jgi:hypothetical protein
MIFDDRTADGDPTQERAIRYVSGSFRMKDSTGVFDPRAGSGLSEAGHKVLRQLIHFIDNGPAEGFASGAYRETLPSADPFPTSVIWYTDSGKTDKIVEKLITYTGVVPTQIQWKMYDVDGSTVLATITDAISYSGVFETSRTRTIA